MRVTFLGSGDAFSAGGRFQTCILVETGESRVLVDCGGTSLTALRRHGVDPNTIDAILLTHLHGDHFGGVPLLILEAMVSTNRTRPLTVAGPDRTEDRVRDLGEVLYPDMWRHEGGFPLTFTEVPLWAHSSVAGLRLTPYPVDHSPAANPTALRIEAEGRTLTYSGDAGWCDGLVEAARDVHLLICECYFFLPRGSGHMDYKTLSARLPELKAERVVLTHMGEEMLARSASLSIETANDGKTIEV